MSWIEGSGKTVEEAVASALAAAGLSEDAAEVEVIEEPSGGRFFGSKARVRVRPAGEDAPAEDEDLEGAAADVPATEKAECAVEFLEGLVDVFGVEAEVTSRVEEDVVFVDIRGKNLGLLIGRQGRTLGALHEVTRTVVQRRLQTYIRLVLDVEGYRERRREALAEYARKLSARVRETGNEVALEPMNPADRKVVHDTVNEEEGVTTYSEGREPKRSVVIAPA